MKVLITGGTGTLGKAICKKLIEYDNIDQIVVLNHTEYGQFLMKNELGNEDKLKYILTDIRELDALKLSFRGVDIVIHCAALKHIDILESNPIEAKRTNIDGSLNVMLSAIDCGVKKVLAISTDKAVDACSLYGASKLFSDKMFINANVYNDNSNTLFSVVRFGNFYGSRGSVVEKFKKMTDDGVKQLPITDFKMDRFFIDPEVAADRAIEVLGIMRGGEIFVPKMDVKKITKIAREINPEAELVEIGLRPGEKLHEILVSEADDLRTIEEGNFWITKHYSEQDLML